MQVAASIFKAYDIRGVVPATLDEAVAQGALAPMNTEATATAMLAYLEGMILLAKTRNDPDVILLLGPAIKTLRIELSH